MLTGKVIYVEVELESIGKKKFPGSFVKQMNKFSILAKDVLSAKRKRITAKFKGQSGFEFRGWRRLRSLYRKIKKEKREPLLLIISDSSVQNISVNNLSLKLKSAKIKLGNINYGWITFKKIKNMQGLPLTANVINYNLRK